jgi:1-acyl-sn-glycerol-3-phosphate acyltransferase
MVNQPCENLLHTQLDQTWSNYEFCWFDWFCLWYPPGWLILFNRHWQHYHPDPDGWNWLEYFLFLIPGGFYLALFMRWLRLGCRLPHHEVVDFNPGYQQAFRKELLSKIVKHYFRGELRSCENLPQTQPMIVAMNHAGMCFPWDFLTLGYLLSEKKGWIVQPIANVALFEHPWITWWLPPGWSNVLGGVRAEKNDFETAVQRRRIILYAPEGIRGPAKGWSKRYHLEKFDPSFVRLSDRYQVPILPVICVGSENLHPWTVNLRQIQQLLKLPFLPVSPLIPLLILFPSMGVWAMKTNLRYYVQTLEKPACIKGIENNSRKVRTLIYEYTQRLREKMQFKLTLETNKEISIQSF